MGTWIKLEDGFPENPKVVAAGHLAGWLYICGLAYCSRNLTDGRIPKGVIPRLTDLPKPRLAAARLVAVGLWADEGDVYRVHDYGEYQRSAEQVERERASARFRKRNQRANGHVTPMSRRDIAGSHADVTAMSRRESRSCHSDVTRPESETETEGCNYFGFRVTKEVVHRRPEPVHTPRLEVAA